MFFFVIDEKSLSRLKELLEQYKLEIPEPDFADDNVVERRTVQFRVDYSFIFHFRKLFLEFRGIFIDMREGYDGQI